MFSWVCCILIFLSPNSGFRNCLSTASFNMKTFHPSRKPLIVLCYPDPLHSWCNFFHIRFRFRAHCHSLGNLCKNKIGFFPHRSLFLVETVFAFFTHSTQLRFFSGSIPQLTYGMFGIFGIFGTFSSPFRAPSHSPGHLRLPGLQLVHHRRYAFRKPIAWNTMGWRHKDVTPPLMDPPPGTIIGQKTDPPQGVHY